MNRHNQQIYSSNYTDTNIIIYRRVALLTKTKPINIKIKQSNNTKITLPSGQFMLKRHQTDIKKQVKYSNQTGIKNLT